VYINKGLVAIEFQLLDDIELDIILKWRNNWSIRQWMYNSVEIDGQKHLAWCKNLINDRHNKYWLIRDENLYKLGVIYLNNIDYYHKFAELGIYKNPNNDTKGVGTKLINMLFEISTKQFHLRKLYLEVFETNIVAINFYKKHGFVECGRLKKHVVSTPDDGGAFSLIDVIIMEKFIEKE